MNLSSWCIDIYIYGSETVLYKTRLVSLTYSLDLFHRPNRPTARPELQFFNSLYTHRRIRPRPSGPPTWPRRHRTFSRWRASRPPPVVSLSSRAKLALALRCLRAARSGGREGRFSRIVVVVVVPRASRRRISSPWLMMWTSTAAAVV